LAEVERVCSVSLRSFLVRNWCGNRQARDYCTADTAADNKFKSRSRNTRWLRNVKGDPSRSPSAVSQESVVAGARLNRLRLVERAIPKLARIDRAIPDAGENGQYGIDWLPRPCPYRKSNPDVLMVQTSEVWGGHDTANGLHSTRRWCILVQR
jgi:hypothetical protein